MRMKIGANAKSTQIGLLLLSSIIMLISLSFLLFDQSLFTVLLPSSMFFLLLFVNYKLKNLHNIRIVDDEIIINNIYMKESYSVFEFDSVSITGFYFPISVFPTSPSSFDMNLKNGKRFRFETAKKLPYFQNLFCYGGKEFARNLTEEISEFIEENSICKENNRITFV